MLLTLEIIREKLPKNNNDGDGSAKEDVAQMLDALEFHVSRNGEILKEVRKKLPLLD